MSGIAPELPHLFNPGQNLRHKSFHLGFCKIVAPQEQELVHQKQNAARSGTVSGESQVSWDKEELQK